MTALLLATGCADMMSLATLRRKLSEDLGREEIGVTLADGLIITVTVVDEASAATPCDSLAAYALRVAQAVRTHYAGFDSLNAVGVSYVRRDADDSSRTSPTHLPFRFGREGLKTGRVASDSASGVALCELD